jgi:hypothetical protein
VAGCTPYLLKYIKDRPLEELSRYDTQLFTRALNELNDFMLKDGIEFVYINLYV